jgi:hypothetical protein
LDLLNLSSELIPQNNCTPLHTYLPATCLLPTTQASEVALIFSNDATTEYQRDFAAINHLLYQTESSSSNNLTLSVFPFSAYTTTRQQD